MTTCRIRRVASATASIIVVAFLTAISGAAQGPDKSTDMAPAPDKVELPKRVLPADFALTKTGEATIRGQRVPYRVTTGTQPVYGEDGATIAALHYTYYERTGVTDLARRPLFVSFNGGPGSGSLWLHLGYTSQKLLVIGEVRSTSCPSCGLAG